MGRKLWVVALALFLVLWGLLQVTNLQFALQSVVLGFLAIAAGVLLVCDK